MAKIKRIKKKKTTNTLKYQFEKCINECKNSNLFHICNDELHFIQKITGMYFTKMI